MSHILITGGTGMLSGAVKNFLSVHDTVSVIARNESGFKKLSAETDYPQRLIPLILDYSDTKLLSENLKSTVQTHGPIVTAVNWIHSHSEYSHIKICEILNSQNSKSDYYHILGSAYYNPSKTGSDIEQFFSKYENVNYKKIILGFKIVNGMSRWLTDHEIYDGVTEAVKVGADEFKIGVTEPWEERP